MPYVLDAVVVTLLAATDWSVSENSLTPPIVSLLAVGSTVSAVKLTKLVPFQYFNILLVVLYIISPVCWPEFGSDGTFSTLAPKSWFWLNCTLSKKFIAIVLI
jgi:hypothetical protein